MFSSLYAECIEFLSQRRSGAVLIDSRHGEGAVSEKKESQSVELLLDMCCDGQPVKSS